ncbi:uncharacterized protein PGTG_07777 [Puccinia graminis f. sp. tritici CRL 75-36-700-3]|uniref:Uncharacterized protein n=1 Tax=Puccinia graminis f. sp. tritici (strain CRL 75-36-700-3 / race SCCL) TaxID=418459 RepID=E3KBR5_PUCGT|nr:uncharacterized protein PGTG_07777 [Puccinia graminis f. sp. tritici CRL 75-36-700-3]EFP81528.1 hypothetical protein PGTG_07777 [Puccinia graminis f. sp. tritici CRL 75-36-700-3]
MVVFSRLVIENSSWPGKQEPRKKFSKLDPSSPREQPQLRIKHRCNPVYVISICDFRWKKTEVPESALGDRVDATLEKLVWILANTGQDSEDQLIPDWVETDPTAKLFIDKLRYDTLTPEEKHSYKKKEGEERSYLAGREYEIKEQGIVFAQQLAKELAKQREQIRQTLQSKGIDPSILDKFMKFLMSPASLTKMQHK